MTILFQSNIRNLMIGRGIIGGLAATVGVTIYSGVQPSAATIAGSWSSYNSANSNFLINFPAVGWTHPISGTVTFASITAFPAATPATNTGTGTWCIVWSINPTAPQLASGTIPSTSFLVGPVTNLAGNGIVRFNPNTNFTIAVNATIADGTISASST